MVPRGEPALLTWVGAGGRRNHGPRTPPHLLCPPAGPAPPLLRARGSDTAPKPHPEAPPNAFVSSAPGGGSGFLLQSWAPRPR